MLDLSLAIGHHLLIFALFGVLVAELLLVRRGLDGPAAAGIVRIDAWYGALAGLILVVGFSRAVFAAKGWAYYAHNGFFWGKVATFAGIGLLSVPPTLTYFKWKRAAAAPDGAQVIAVRRYLYAQLALFALLPALAAAMARGYGGF